MPTLLCTANPTQPAHKHCRFAAAAVLALGCSQAVQAITIWDEVTLYLSSASYSPGSTVDTTFYFGSKPAVELSSFDFKLTWDNALAQPVASGPGSVADWTSTLGSKGSASYTLTSPQVIKGSWLADPLGGSASFISTSYNHLKWAVFTFETDPALNLPFVVSIELTNIKNAAGDVMDVGSGFITWATMAPVPEPATWLSLMCGLVAITRLCRNRSSCVVHPRYCRRSKSGCPPAAPDMAGVMGVPHNSLCPFQSRCITPESAPLNEIPHRPQAFNDPLFHRPRFMRVAIGLRTGTFRLGAPRLAVGQV